MGFPTSDIEYLIESNRWTASDKLYITQLLPTRYPINITNADEPHGSLFMYFRIFTPLADDHVITSHVTGITWPIPTFADQLRSFPLICDDFRSIPINIALSPTIIQFNCTKLLHRRLVTAKPQRPQILSIEVFISELISPPAQQNSVDTSTQPPRHRLGILPISVIWSYCGITWSRSVSKLVILLLDLIRLSSDIKFTW